MSKSLANSKILKRVSRRKMAESAKDGVEHPLNARFPLKNPPQKKSLLKLGAHSGQSLLKRRMQSDRDKTIRTKGKRALEALDESY
jgi:hypothetical protein